MVRSLAHNRACWLVFGVLVGVAAVVAGRLLLETPVYATATHGVDSFAIATGELDEGLEAIYFLDFLTGELKAAVLNVRNGKFLCTYAYANIPKDLGLDQVKNPRYLMVTGTADMRRGSGPYRLGRGIVYISELNSGAVAAYAIPWDPGSYSRQIPVNGTFVPLDRIKFRDVEVRQTY
jgi:hypothetical protein